jgi:hypothetical protein
MLALVPWRGMAQGAKVRAFWNKYNPAISTDWSLVACKARSTPVPKLVQSNDMLNPLLAGALIGCLHLCHVVARPKVQKSGHSGINGFPAISVDWSLVCVQGKINKCSKDDQVQGKVQPSSLVHFDRRFACIKIAWKGSSR